MTQKPSTLQDTLCLTTKELYPHRHCYFNNHSDDASVESHCMRRVKMYLRSSMPAERFWGIALLLAYRDTTIEEHLRKCRRLAFASMWCYQLGRQRQSPPWRLPNCNEPLHWISFRTVGYLRSYIKHSIISVSCSLQIPGRWFKTFNCTSIFQSTSWCLDISSSVFAVNSARESSIIL